MIDMDKLWASQAKLQALLDEPLYGDDLINLYGVRALDTSLPYIPDCKNTLQKRNLVKSLSNQFKHTIRHLL